MIEIKAQPETGNLILTPKDKAKRWNYRGYLPHFNAKGRMVAIHRNYVDERMAKSLTEAGWKILLV